MELCKPATIILLVSIAGTLYHLITGHIRVMMWWVAVGVFGTGLFQGLCYGGIEPVAWVVMAIPILIVCFFLAVALFASRMRIENVMTVPCDRCGHKHQPHNPCEPKCNKTQCNKCHGCGCPHCLGTI